MAQAVHWPEDAKIPPPVDPCQGAGTDASSGGSLALVLSPPFRLAIWVIMDTTEIALWWLVGEPGKNDVAPINDIQEPCQHEKSSKTQGLPL